MAAMMKSAVSAQALSSKVSFKVQKPSRVVAKAPKAVTTCAADNKLAQTLAVAAFAASIPLAVPQMAQADVAGLTPCKDSAAFKKREKSEIKALNRRLKQYDPESAPALALNATIEKTKTRFANYGSYGLLCGADGLPHLIVDGDLNHLGEFVIPGVGFLYIAGWIGYAGRDYVQWSKTQAKPRDNEIIINVPTALGMMFSASTWPLSAVNELRFGTLTAAKEDITVSPR